MSEATSGVANTGRKFFRDIPILGSHSRTRDRRSYPRSLNPAVSFSRLARRGASTGDVGLMEQAGCAAGDQASGPGANDEGVIRLCGACGSRPRQPDSRAASGHALGALGPLCEELARRIGANADPGSADRSRKMPQQSAERRAGPRHGPVISGDPEMDLTARQVIGCGASAPAPVGALLPSFFGEQKWTRGRPSLNGLAERWLFDNSIAWNFRRFTHVGPCDPPS